MDIQTILLIITTIINFGWGLLILIYGRSKKPNLVFSSVVFSVVLWSVSMMGYRFSENNILNWSRFLYVTAILIPLAFLYFNLVFPEGKKTNKFFLYFIPLPAIILISLTLFGDRIIIDTFQVEGSENKILFGNFYIFYVLYIAGYFSWSFIILTLNQIKYTGIIRAQSRYILIGAVSASIVAMITNLILPWFNIFIVNWLGQVATFLWVSFTSYAMIKYRLMDLRIVARKVVVYLFSAGFVYGTFYLVIWVYEKVFGGVHTSGAYLLGLLIAPLFVLFFVLLNSKIKNLVNKYLFFSLYSHQEIMAKLTDKLTSSIDLEKIIDSIVNSIKEAMQSDKVGIFLSETEESLAKYKISKVVGFNEKNGISLVQDIFLTQHLQKTQKPLVKDELRIIAREIKDPFERQRFFNLSENMERIEASLCLPMIISNKLIGIIVLGKKVSEDAYTNEDIDLLSTLSKQAAIAVDNARLYKQIQDFSKTLQQKVDEQTKEIKEQKEKVEEAYEIEKRANLELKKLDEAKTQFMLITQHHLRTPLSVNMGFLELLTDGRYGKISKKTKVALDELTESTLKEIQIVNELLDVSSYQLGKEMIRLEKDIDMEELFEETLKDLKVQAEKKGIYLNFEKHGSIPKIPADRIKLKLALTNVIDNCVKYTKEGGVTVAIEIKDNKFLIIVKDTGVGLPEKLMEGLFKQTFYRGQEAQKISAIGKGIGLFLSGKIIEGHHGKIWVESKGEGKGAIFYIELPLE